MEPSSAAEDAREPAADTIRFRTTKKRKGYRQRATDDDVATAAAVPIAPRAASPRDDMDLTKGIDVADADIAGGNGDNEDDANEEDREEGGEEEEESAVAAALRLRNARKTGRLRGVGFKSDGRLGDNTEQSLVVRGTDGSNGAENAVVGGIENRFMHQTGLLTILDDRHMNAYIESRLASRNAPSGTPDPSASSRNEDGTTTTATTATAGGVRGRGGASAPNKLADQPASHGKLVEVAIPEEIQNRDAYNKRRRVEKSTKPPRRGRNRRNSDDIMRDNLVEQFLHENRRNRCIRRRRTPQASTSAPGADPSADDRLAEQFRQQYLDDQAMRRKKKRPAQQQQRQQPSADVLKGPKLGGSRNQRAAVRDILLQQQERKTK
ncbi:hypothetical protein PT974_08857 [Cladobotryum mycophilum]|uniref:G-patch domain-containing protein n=1 Tax=Cladobotryum mycophilum TaxID=491253 RepID=A0ABR0SEJ6_9HYPO